MSARQIMTMVRHFRWLYVVIFILGGVAGALVRPYVVPVWHEQVYVYPTQDGCDFDLDAQKYHFGSLSAFADGGGKLACGEGTELSPTMLLTCECRK